jgi:hypothetical protein
VRVDATMDSGLSRWLWLVKWLLVIPHLVVLAFLWVAFIVLSIGAFFAILVSGTYPRSVFDFNVGVLRWTWRVAFYAYGTLGSDRYPPFTLADVPDYPAHLEVDYPARLSRGLAAVKWWLLAIPHYLVVGVFVGGAWAIGREAGDVARTPGLIGLLVLIAGVALLFTGRYPRPIFDFVLGMNRWALRVAAYAGLMTDEYPPFRMDLGGSESTGGATVTVPARDFDRAAGPPQRRGWNPARVVSVVAGSVVGLAALGVLGAGGVAAWATTTQRDAAGYLTTESRSLDTSSYAITSENIHLSGPVGWWAPTGLLGTIRVRATNVDPQASVFIGVGPTARTAQYLRGVPHMVVNEWGVGGSGPTGENSAPIPAPESSDVWTAHVSGSGTQSLVWPARNGSWVLAVMNADGRPNVAVQADVGVTLPALGTIAVVLIAVGVALTAGAIALIAVPIARASRPDDPHSEGDSS